MKVRLPIRRRWLQISVRTLLVIVLACCVLLAVWTSRARRQEAIVRKVIGLGGGYVTYVHEVDASGKAVADPVPPGPAWLRGLMGDQALFQLYSIGSGGLEDDDLEVLAEFPTIQRLQLGERLTDAGIAHLARLKNLRLLDTESWGITDQGVKSLAALERLEFLNLNYALVTDRGLESLAGLENLTYLNLWNTQVTADGVAGLRAKLPRVKVDPRSFPAAAEEREIVQELIRAGIRFEADKDGWIEDVHLFGPRIGDESLAIVQRLQRVKTLFLLNTRVTTAGIDRLLAVHPHLKALPQLRTPHADDAQAVAALRRCGAKLFFDDAGHVRDVQLADEALRNEDLAALSGLAHVTAIGILSPRISDDGMQYLEGCTSLTYLGLSRPSLSDAGLRRLTGLKNLKSLEVHGIGITDEGLSAIQDLPALSRLLLRETSVTGRGFSKLAGLTELKQLVLIGSPVDDAGLAVLPRFPKLEGLLVQIIDAEDRPPGDPGVRPQVGPRVSGVGIAAGAARAVAFGIDDHVRGAVQKRSRDAGPAFLAALVGIAGGGLSVDQIIGGIVAGSPQVGAADRGGAQTGHQRRAGIRGTAIGRDTMLVNLVSVDQGQDAVLRAIVGAVEERFLLDVGQQPIEGSEAAGAFVGIGNVPGRPSIPSR